MKIVHAVIYSKASSQSVAATKSFPRPGGASDTVEIDAVPS